MAVALNTATPAGTTLVVRNNDATNTVSLGGSGVAAGAGFLLAVGATVNIPLNAGEQVFAIRDGAADVVVSVIRTAL